MRAEFALLCRGIVGDSLPADFEAAGIDTVWLPEVPGAVQLFLALSLKGTAEEFVAGVEHTVEVYLIGPGPSSLADVNYEFTELPPPGHDPAWEVPSFHRLILDFEALAYGAHLVEVYVDGANVASVPVVVRQP